MQDKKILYIHGFASDNNSVKGNILKHYFKDNVLTPKLEVEPFDAIEQLKKIVSSEKPEIVIGSSLGGFYALVLLDIFNLKTICINPSVKPVDRIPAGTYRRASIYDTFEWTEKCNEQLKILYANHVKNIRYSPENLYFYISTDDEVIPNLKQSILDHFKNYAVLKEFDDNTHRFYRFEEIIPDIKAILLKN